MLGHPARFFAAFCLAVGLASPALAGFPPYILVNAETGQILASRQAFQLWAPASVTKLMTAYLTFRALDEGKLTPTSPVTMSARAAAEAPVKMGYRAGTVITVDNALKMMLVYSANDIAVALAETVGGSLEGFVAEMNATAAELGMASTHYDNPNGLPSSGQLTTARDLALLSRTIWRDYPQYHDLFGIPAIQDGARLLHSSNTLLRLYRGTAGLKTGFTCASGFNLAALVERDGKTLIAVVLGAASSSQRADLAARLLDRGFSGASLTEPEAPSLSAEVLPSPSAAAGDMSPEICGGRKSAAIEGDANFAGGPSPLQGGFRVADPVKVAVLGDAPSQLTPAAEAPAPTKGPLRTKLSPKPAGKPAPKAASANGARKQAAVAPRQSALRTAKPVAVKVSAPAAESAPEPEKPHYITYVPASD